jgi:hypothetical protein
MTHRPNCRCDLCDGQAALRRAMRGVLALVAAYWLTRPLTWGLEQAGKVADWCWQRARGSE